MPNPQPFFEFLPSDEFIAEYLKVFEYTTEIGGTRVSTRPDITSTYLPDPSEPVDNARVKESIAQLLRGHLGTVRRETMWPFMDRGYSGEKPNKLTASIVSFGNFSLPLYAYIRDEWFGNKVQSGHSGRMTKLLARDFLKQVRDAGGSVRVHAMRHLYVEETETVFLVANSADGLDLQICNPDYDYMKLMGPDGKPSPPVTPCKILEPPK